MKIGVGLNEYWVGLNPKWESNWTSPNKIMDLNWRWAQKAHVVFFKIYKNIKKRKEMK